MRRPALSGRTRLRRPAGEHEVQAFAAITATAFAATQKESEAWLAKAGHDTLRLLHRGRHLAGGLMILPMGQWFGGRVVPTGGIAAVAVDPQHRAQGVATAMMIAALREMRSQGHAISALFPATVPLYRRAGYELAGTVHEITLPPRDLVERDRRLDLREVDPDEIPALRRAYRERARRTNGNLERSDYFWRRIREPFGAEPARAFAVWRGREVEGYVYYTIKRAETGRYTLRLTDLVALTPDAARRLLTFFADHRTLADVVIWLGSVRDPLLLVLAEHTYRIRLAGQWMLRILDLAAALEARGYPRQVAARVHLRVRDENLRANHGAFVLDVSDGRARVRRGGRGSVRIHARALAGLYSGHWAPQDLVAGGMLQAAPRELGALGLVFAGSAPWMPDTF